MPRGPVAGYCQAELINAAQITSPPVRRHGADPQAVGVMTAIGESAWSSSTWRPVGPDSRGLFQQRDNGAWGARADRIDPYTAASIFLAKLRSKGWKTDTAADLARAVPVNDDPDYCQHFWDDAQPSWRSASQ